MDDSLTVPVDVVNKDSNGAVPPQDNMEVTDQEEGESAKTNPYAYLERDDFSSERFKLELKNLPRKYGFRELKKFLLKLSLNPHKIKAGHHQGQFAFVSFRTLEDRDKAIAKLNGQKWKNNVLQAVYANAAKDPLIQRRAKQGEEEALKTTTTNQEEHEESTNESLEPISEVVKKVTCPWYNIPYEEQLNKKNELVKSYMSSLSKELRGTNSDLVAAGSIVCPYKEIHPSPITEVYRNKCEFTIGHHPETKEKTVGFRLASYKKGSTFVGPIEGLTHLPPTMVDAALAFQSYIQNSIHDPFDPETHGGVWRQLTVRVNRKNHVLLLVIISDRHLTVEEVQKIKSELRDYFKDMTQLDIKSLSFKIQESSGQQAKNSLELLLGEAFITEIISGLSFRISAESFFQINSEGMEVLLTVLKENAGLTDETSLLDVCCGTGTIGQMLAPQCGQVLGIEMVLSAIQDAKENALRNNLQDKCTYFCGKAEDLLDAVISSEVKLKNIVAIVDPPRSGLHTKVLQVLRRCTKIDTVVYVACNPDAAKRNFLDFARLPSKKYRGPPFKPHLVIPVDMFPQTHHMELVIVLKRDYTGFSNPSDIAGYSW